MCTTGIQDMYHSISMAASVDTVVKGVCHHAGSIRLPLRGLFYSVIFRQPLFIKIQMKCHYAPESLIPMKLKVLVLQTSLC